MSDLPPARALRRAPGPSPDGARWHDRVPLTHDERLLRRRRLVTLQGQGVLVDLPETLRVEHGDAFDLGDGRLIEVVAAEEPLIEVRTPAGAEPGLARLAWHLGNRHCPCQIEAGRLLLPRDPVLRAMLLGLGAEVPDVSEPFHPEGGAYAHAHVPDEAGLGHLAAR